MKFMKLAGIILKVIVVIGVLIKAIQPEDPLSWVVLFGMLYGLATYYVWYFKEYGFSFGAYIGSGGIIMTFLSFCFKLILPLIFIVAPYLVLNAALPGQLGMYIGGILLIALCIGCVVWDVIGVIRVFQPSFLAESAADKLMEKVFPKKGNKEDSATAA